MTLLEFRKSAMVNENASVTSQLVGLHKDIDKTRHQLGHVQTRLDESKRL